MGMATKNVEGRKGAAEIWTKDLGEGEQVNASEGVRQQRRQLLPAAARIECWPEAAKEGCWWRRQQTNM
jgi:hypothetical protein